MTSSSIKYKSTRGGESGLSFEDVVLGGLAKDKGLYVPESIPTFTYDEIESFRKLSYVDLSYHVISKFVQPDEIDTASLKDILKRSFDTFRTPEVTPSIKLHDYWILELFHGPTFAFKDVALQFLGNVFEHFLVRGRKQKSITILGATSGDTGSAAIHGLRGKSNVNCFIMYPTGKVTDIQERQMTVIPDENVQCISIDGDFDDCQALVKAAFADEKFRNDINLGAINSINWARVLAQITYYFYCWLRVTDKVNDPRNKKVNFAVPTGNFGDILAGYYAKKMGLPVGKLVICANENDVLHRFLQTGTYTKLSCQQTIAPSMDISVSSNFERLLLYIASGSTDTLAAWMKSFEDTGSMSVSAEQLAMVKADFDSYASSKELIVKTMKDLYAKEQYLVCPHTATAVAAVVAKKMVANYTVVLATAHPAKFEESLLLALGSIPTRPQELEALFGLPTRATHMKNSLSDVQQFIKKHLGVEDKPVKPATNKIPVVPAISVIEKTQPNLSSPPPPSSSSSSSSFFSITSILTTLSVLAIGTIVFMQLRRKK